MRHLKSDIASHLGDEAANELTSGGGQVDPRTLSLLPAPLRSVIYEGIASSLSTVFVWAIPFAAAVAVLAFFITQVKLRGHEDAQSAVEHEGPAPRPALALAD